MASLLSPLPTPQLTAIAAPSSHRRRATAPFSSHRFLSLRRGVRFSSLSQPDPPPQRVHEGPLFFHSEDMDYIWKLVAGSIAGAIIIKYGSIIFPEITRPSLVQALSMILVPVVVSIVLLFKRSRFDNQS